MNIIPEPRIAYLIYYNREDEEPFLLGERVIAWEFVPQEPELQIVPITLGGYSAIGTHNGVYYPDERRLHYYGGELWDVQPETVEQFMDAVAPLLDCHTK